MAELFGQAGDVCWDLVHPQLGDKVLLGKLEALSRLARKSPPEEIAALVIGPTWRERLVGLVLSQYADPLPLPDAILTSLRTPLGLSVVPAFAALAAQFQAGLLSSLPSSCRDLDRTALDGELGWTLDKALFATGTAYNNPVDLAPSSGQSFDDHLALYNKILADRSPQ